MAEIRFPWQKKQVVKEEKSPTVAVQQITEEQKKQAAYALNICTVSVSQIVDYQDLYIMEQEYEAILNNLNLENMPKDEALLSILKEILNVITYFRIQDGDKKMIEAEYQHKMKNAIWSAVPNITGFMGDSPTAIAASLAMQVGVGYMNYRRQKAENQLAYKEEQWALQRTAIEQLNALRRELFDTAWRLAEHYQFPDEYRLTEQQIRQYNLSLLDPDPMKRYERLSYISDGFAAYPPFAYQMGHAAGEVFFLYQKKIDSITDAARKEEYSAIAHRFKDKALEHYTAFLAGTDCNLLRYDQLRAACALEKFDFLMLEDNRNASALRELLDCAIRNASNSFDVIELCALGYLRLRDANSAKRELSMLVNERYNTVMNAQLLSRLYIEEQSQDARSKHRILGERVGPEYLYPWVDNLNDAASSDMFLKTQKSILARRFSEVLQDIIDSYTVKYNRALSYSSDNSEPDISYSDSKEALEQRLSLAEETAESSPQYLDVLAGKMFGRLDVLNELCKQIEHFPNGDVQSFYDDIAATMGPIAKECLSSPIKQENLKLIIVDMQFSVVTQTAFTNLADRICDKLRSCKDLAAICQFETQLFHFCNQNGYQFPALTIGDQSDRKELAPPKRDFRNMMHNFEQYQRESEQRTDMLSKIKEYKPQILREDGSSKAKLWVCEDWGFDDYFKSKQGKRFQSLRDHALAVLDDQSFSNADLIFLDSGICKAYLAGDAIKDNLNPVNLALFTVPFVSTFMATYNGIITAFRLFCDTTVAPYGDVKREGMKIEIGEDNVIYKNLDPDALVDLCRQLDSIYKKYNLDPKTTVIPSEATLSLKLLERFSSWDNADA